jgi:NADH-ubiquinone oxidoreductase chain 6
MIQVLLESLPLVAVASSILVVTSQNPVFAVLSLVVVFIALSAYMAILGLTFVSLVYLIIYVGAIAMLFLFVIMLMDLKLVELSVINEAAEGGEYPSALVIGLLAVFAFKGLIPFPHYPSVFDTLTLGLAHATNSFQWVTSFVSFSQVETLGFLLFTTYPLLLIMTGLILLIALIGPILVAFEGPTHPGGPANSSTQSSLKIPPKARSENWENLLSFLGLFFSSPSLPIGALAKALPNS